MRFGVTMIVTDRSIGAVELARAVEERGLGSLWLPEHTHIPTSRRTPWPERRGPAARGVQAALLDPLVALAAAAPSPPRCGSGPASAAAQRDPIVTAKAVATSTTSPAAGSLSAWGSAGTRTR